ncbi:hypothetical protein A2856_02675 [Candidatus Uhrbacteria bacterium RIFCSPHIGHO2_01_FULL_63_20]|uniref:DUF304 domain-containing protein n=1 Tax=Candidatus Uhrbacteria bacterium RIFCSPHIGHO2_01_FULL_63_20 TaxID=1802385 RepID=A0A1F7TKP8_9BACT|nr:MAG: hypothetical protein A2856_02675 [Candidatus Uhrbacteria bacterium RIFCSPHIGHO2_01_FULL_63_20]
MNLEKIIQLRPEEEILLAVRQVVLPHLPKFFLLSVWFLLPFFLLFPLFRLGGSGVVLFFALLIPAIALTWRAYRRWSDTMLVITDRRVIDIERRGLFDTEVCEAAYGDIDEVTFRIKGLVPTLCRYGDVEVKIAGAAADIEFKRCDRPGKVHDLIADLRRASRDPDSDPRERRIRRLARTVSMDEIEGMERADERRTRQEAAEEFFTDEPGKG